MLNVKISQDAFVIYHISYAFQGAELASLIVGSLSPPSMMLYFLTIYLILLLKFLVIQWIFDLDQFYDFGHSVRKFTKIFFKVSSTIIYILGKEPKAHSAWIQNNEIGSICQLTVKSDNCQYIFSWITEYHTHGIYFCINFYPPI